MMRPETPSEWKPGDVAMRRGLAGHEQRSVVVSSHGCRDKHTPEPHWHHAAGGWDLVEASHQLARYRPLVVIDPEDAEQVERLGGLLLENLDELAADNLHAHWAQTALIQDLQSALREFARPTPRIEEPLGLGAVVEDADGERWVRTNRSEYPWDEEPYRDEDGDETWESRLYTDIRVVRVLSHGVTEGES